MPTFAIAASVAYAPTTRSARVANLEPSVPSANNFCSTACLTASAYQGVPVVSGLTPRPLRSAVANSPRVTLADGSKLVSDLPSIKPAFLAASMNGIAQALAVSSAFTSAKLDVFTAVST
ncbi:hypothetical protein D3C84_1064670 [compost metagenome]